MRYANLLRKLEAPPGFEPGMEVLQTSALPLGDGAFREFAARFPERVVDGCATAAGADLQTYRGMAAVSRSADNSAHAQSGRCLPESRAYVEFGPPIQN